MATAAQVAEYREATQSLVLLAQRDLRDFVLSLNLSADPTVVRAAFLAFFPELIAGYGGASALLGSDWYDMLRREPPSVARFRAALAAPVDPAQAVGSARWGLGPLFEGDQEAALSLLSGSTQRLVMKPFRDTVFRSARADPRPRSFARVPSGPTTCRWCVMLASRGFVYATAQNAGESDDFHDNCDCMIIPGSGMADYPDGYDLDEYRRLYAEQTGFGRNN